MLEEASEIQDLRNTVIHRGQAVSLEQAELAVEVATQVFNQVLVKVLGNLGFTVKKGGIIVHAEV